MNEEKRSVILQTVTYVSCIAMLENNAFKSNVYLKIYLLVIVLFSLLLLYLFCCVSFLNRRVFDLNTVFKK